MKRFLPIALIVVALIVLLFLVRQCRNGGATNFQTTTITRGPISFGSSPGPLRLFRHGFGDQGAWLLAFASEGDMPHNLAYFWLSGALSAFLDNAPTYLVFFELAGGNANELMGPLAGTLVAISIGASSMGALTYIGNAPNLMIYAIAVERGIAMPSFFGFMVWSAAVLLPVFAIGGYVFFG